MSPREIKLRPRVGEAALIGLGVWVFDRWCDAMGRLRRAQAQVSTPGRRPRPRPTRSSGKPSGAGSRRRPSPATAPAAAGGADPGRVHRHVARRPRTCGRTRCGPGLSFLLLHVIPAHGASPAPGIWTAEDLQDFVKAKLAAAGSLRDSDQGPEARGGEGGLGRLERLPASTPPSTRARSPGST